MPSKDIRPMFDLEPDEVKSLEAKASESVAHGSDYEHLRGQLAAMEDAKEPVLLVPAQAVWELVWHWRQLSEMLTQLTKMTKHEHELLKELQRLKAEHADDLDRITGKVLQCEREVRDLRAWKNKAIQDYEIPDTDE